MSVIQNEGSAKSTVINCITLGLANAGIAMRDLLISCTAGMLYGNVLIDTNEDEEYDVTNELTLSYLNSERKMDCL